MSRHYLEVALPPPLAREFTYGTPPDMVDDIQAGSLVLVPVGRQLRTGIVLGQAQAPQPGDKFQEKDIRDIVQVVAGDILLDADIIDLCRWMSAYYFAPLGSALTAALPPGVKLDSNRIVELRPSDQIRPPCNAQETDLLEQLQHEGPLKATTLHRRFGRRETEKILNRLKRRGLIEIRPEIRTPTLAPISQQHVRPTPAAQDQEIMAMLEKRAKRQAACLTSIIEHGSCAKRTLAAEGFAYTQIKALADRGLVEIFEVEITRDPLATLITAPPDNHELTPDQDRVLNAVYQALDAGEFYPSLVQGVTGSGKTLVYIHAIAHCLAQGRNAIVLVPEIALAWQMVRRFKAHFGAQVAVMHSQLSPGERYDTWRRLRRGEQRLVIGARSAVLAPLPKVGLLVVDEEHDSSYKQEDLDGQHSLSYSARDLALVRGQRLRAVVLLGSATPSLETYQHACDGKYHLLSLPTRVDNRPLPSVEVVDMRREPFQRKQRALFSKLLRHKITERLQRGEQIILLQNRRGFAPCVACGSCGETIQCASCHISLTYHRSASGNVAQLRCHYCDFITPLPPTCPHCSSAELTLEGVGTQRVEEALVEQFPNIRVIRMDVDTTGWKGAHDHLVESFRRREADVLLGTQMVAKGLDFPAVTLVGVISADTGLHMPDFRASERSFQLLTQVAGRSGRGTTPGEVVIQTMLPTDPVLQAASRQDFSAFVENELAERRAAAFPPFGRLILFRWRGKDEKAVIAAAQQGIARLRHAVPPDQTILGPAPAPLTRLREFYRYQALLSGPTAQAIHRSAASRLHTMRAMALSQSVMLQINVDPLSIM